MKKEIRNTDEPIEFEVTEDFLPQKVTPKESHSLTQDARVCYNRAMKTNIVMTGFMGAGKSLLSKQLAECLKRVVVSTDDLIEDMEGKKISEIFRDEGEAYFRQCEKKVVAQVSEKEDIIIDCGGGIVLDPENISNLKRQGVVFYLAAEPAVIYERIKDQTHRPLLQVDDPLAKIQELLDIRESFYKQADYMIDTNSNEWDQIGQEIMDIMTEERKDA